jgi:hypothetical protein
MQYLSSIAVDKFEEEHTIRENPAAAGSANVSKVFGALK